MIPLPYSLQEVELRLETMILLPDTFHTHTSGVVDLELEAMILLPDSFQTDGVVFAFAAYYRNSNPVRFQLWRPVKATDVGDFQTAAPASSSETTMQLLSQLTVRPSVQDSREIVSSDIFRNPAAMLRLALPPMALALS